MLKQSYPSSEAKVKMGARSWKSKFTHLSRCKKNDWWECQARARCFHNDETETSLMIICSSGDGLSNKPETRCSPRTRMFTRMLMGQMSKHMDMQSRRTLVCNSLFEQSCTYFPCYQSAVWSVKWGVWSVKCGARSVEFVNCRVWCVECRVQSVECTV